MSRYLICLLVLCSPWACRAQQHLDNERIPAQREFATAGEQDEYWARKLFQDQYRYHEHANFKDSIYARLVMGKYQLSYGRDTLTAELNPALLPLLIKGLIYPHVAGFSLQKVCCFQELPHATNSPQRRRFMFWSFEPMMLNPTVYIFEIENRRATVNTDIGSFLKGAVLTFMHEGWLVL
jgi:hypothetical protein